MENSPFDYRHHEDDYFHKQNQAARQKIRERLDTSAADLNERERLAASLGTTESDVLQRARDLGLDEHSAKVIHLLPLVHVAWADQEVTRAERSIILQAARARGIDKDDQAMQFLEAILEHRPSPAFFDQVHDLLRSLLRVRGARPDDMLALCREVAGASGGFLGMGSGISAEEAGLIDLFQKKFGEASGREVDHVKA